MNKEYVVPTSTKMKTEKEIKIKEENVKIQTKEDVKGIESFKGLLINSTILKNMEAQNIVQPTLVQKYVIPLALYGNDLLICAPTGMGKTIAFLVPAINHLLCASKRQKSGYGFRKQLLPKALILTPTRELAMQIHKDSENLSKGLDISSALAYGGGENRKNQVSAIKRGADILIGTPGRLQDFINEGVVNLENIEILIFDEADRMLDMGFEVQIRSLCKGLREDKHRQTMMFSATFPDSVQKIAKDFFQKQYSVVNIGHGPIENITQEIVYIDSAEMKNTKRKEKLISVLSEYGYVPGESLAHQMKERDWRADAQGPPEKKLTWKKKMEPSEPKEKQEKTEQVKIDRPKIVIFVEKKVQCKDLMEFLLSKGIPSTSIHGDKEQAEREEALGLFKRCEAPVLVATSVAARGLDIPGIVLVVNYMMPSDMKEYIHRIGRTGRAGRQGRSITFFSKEDQQNAGQLVDILKKANQEVPTFLEEMAEEKGRGRGKSGFRRKDDAGSSRDGREVKPAGDREHREKGDPYSPLEMRDVLSGESKKIDIEENVSWDTEIE